MPPGGLPQLKFMCEEIRRRSPNSHIVVVYLGGIADYDELLVELRGDGASYLTTSLGQAIHQIEMLRQDAMEKLDTPAIESQDGADMLEGTTHAS